MTSGELPPSEDGLRPPSQRTMRALWNAYMHDIRSQHGAPMVPEAVISEQEEPEVLRVEEPDQE